MPNEFRAPLSDRLSALPEALDVAWEFMVLGATSRHSAMHTPTLATVTPDGTPDTRVVVLRAADKQQRRLRCHTDARSEKISHLTHQSAVAWHFYDKDAKLQIRAAATAKVHGGDDLAGQAWNASTHFARRCYLVEPGPGTPMPEATSGLPDDMLDAEPDDAALVPAFANFSVIETVVTRIDWLYLAVRGHRRGAHQWRDGGWEHTWLIP